MRRKVNIQTPTYNRGKTEKMVSEKTRENLKCIRKELKHDLKTHSLRLKKRQTVEQRNRINREFALSPKNVYQKFKSDESREINPPPPPTRVFSRPFTHGGDLSPPPYGGTSAGGESVNGGGLMRGDIDLMGGPDFDRLYHKPKVLLLLSCNYTMQFIGYDSIKTR